MLGRRKKRESIAKSEVVCVHIVARCERTVGDDIEKNVDHIVLQAAAVRETGRSVVSPTRAGVGDGDIEVQKVAMGHSNRRKYIDVA